MDESPFYDGPMSTSRTPAETIKSLIRTVPDWPSAGIQFRDITPLLASPRGFRVLIALSGKDSFCVSVRVRQE